MLELDVEPITHSGQIRRIDAEFFASELNRAFVVVARQRDLIALSARNEHITIESNVVSDHKVDVVEKRCEFWPKIAKGGRLLHRFPRDSVNVGEGEASARWPYEEMLLRCNLIAVHAHEANRARTVAGVVRRFKVDGQKRRLVGTNHE